MPTITYKSLCYAYPTSAAARDMDVYQAGGWYIAQQLRREDGSMSPATPWPRRVEAFDHLNDPDLIALWAAIDAPVSPYSHPAPGGAA